VAATAHTANWDLVACEVARRLPLTVLTKRLSVGWLDRLWQRTRARRGIRLAEQGAALKAARRALRRGEVVAMMVDQAPERHRAVTSCPFLGQQAYVDLAPALMALRFRRPLVAAFPVRLAEGSYALHLAGVLRPPQRASRPWAEQAMAQVTRWLDEFVRDHPEQWLWMHRRWKGLPMTIARTGDAGLHAPRGQES
jgi:KDO2-lipid IV(A) lauroyltransferase